MQTDQISDEEFYKCMAALETKDLDRFKMQVQESFHQLHKADAGQILEETFKLGWLEGVQCMLEHGADPNDICLGSMFFTYHPSIPMLELLASFGMDYKSQNKNWNNLGYLIHIGDNATLDWLLDHGVDINDPTNDMYPGGPHGPRQDCTVEVLNRVGALGDNNLFDHLVARGAEPSRCIALHRAASSEKAVPMIAHLIDKYNFDVDSDYNSGDPNGSKKWADWPVTPLIFAVRHNNLPGVEALLKYGAKAGTIATNGAIDNNNIPILRLLLDNGSNPTESLICAVNYNQLECCRLCLEYGADTAEVEALDKEGRIGTPYNLGKMGAEMRKLFDEWKINKNLNKMKSGDNDG